MHSLLLAFLVGLIAASGQDTSPPGITVTIEGVAHDAGMLAELEATARQALADIEQESVREGDAYQQRKQALENQVAVLAELRGLVNTLAGATDRKQEIRRALERLQAELTQVRVDQASDIEFATATQEDVDRELTSQSRASAELTQSQNLRRESEDRLVRRQAIQDSAAGAIANLERELEQRRTDLRDAEGERQTAATQAARAAEIRLRTMELQRDYLPQLLDLDRQERDLATARLDLATARAAVAEARVASVRRAHQKSLEAEAERARQDADAQRRMAEMERSPALKALTNQIAVLGEVAGENARVLAQLTGLRTVAEEARVILEQVTSHFESIQNLFPREARLDDWKLGLLREQTDRIERRVRSVERWREINLAGLPSLRADSLRFRDQMEVFRELVGDVVDIELAMERESFHPLVTRWIAIDKEFEQITRDLSGDARTATREEKARTDQQLARAIDEIVQHLGDIESTAARLDQLNRDIDRSLEDRQDYLRSISFWVQSERLWSPSERSAVMDEVRRAWKSLREPGPTLRQTWTRLKLVPGGVASVAAILSPLVLLALWVSWRLRGARRAAQNLSGKQAVTKARRLGRFVVAHTSGRLVLAAAALLLLLSGPVDPLVVATCVLIVSIGAIGLAFAFLDALFGRSEQARGVISCPWETARKGRALGRSLVLLAGVLTPAVLLLEAVKLASMAEWVRLVLGAAALALATATLARRDLIETLVAGQSLLSSTFRTLWVILWPFTILFFGAVLVLRILGYRHASGHFASRSFLCALTLILTVLAYRTLDSLIRRWLGPGDDAQSEDEDASEEATASNARAELLRRFLKLALLVATVGGLAVALSSILGITLEAWQRFGAVRLREPGADSPGIKLWDLGQATLTFLVAMTLAAYLRDLLRVVLRARMNQGSRYVIQMLVFYSVTGLGILLALGTLGVHLGQLGWLLTAAGVGIGFGLQEIISNFVAGLILFFERPVQVGDIISLGEIEGDVRRINIRSTVIRTRDGISIIIPNKRLIVDDVVNWSHGEQRTRLRIPVSVAYGSDVSTVKRVLLDVAEKEGRILKRPRPEVQFLAFGESELQFQLLIWLGSPDITLRRRVSSDLNSSIDAAFQRANITIPFPQRDLHVRSVADGLLPGRTTRDPPAARDAATDA